MQWIKVVVIGVIILFIGLLSYFALLNKYEKNEVENFATWQEFTPSSNLFKVLLPSVPQYAKDIALIEGGDKTRRYDIYASPKIDGTLFLIKVIIYPADTSLSDDVLHQMLNEVMQSKPGNDLLEMDKGSFYHHPSLDFSIENPDFHIEGKTFIVNNIAYILTYTTQKNSFDPLEYEHFIRSFKLLSHP